MSLTVLSLALGFALQPAAPATPSFPALHPAQEEESSTADVEFDERMAGAEGDAEKLLELAQWCADNDRREKSREVYAMVLAIDAQNEAAHKGLRHHFYDGKWFTSYAELSSYRRDEARRMLEEHGLVRFGDEWVAQDDVPFLRMGWVQDENEVWAHPAIAERKKQEAQYEADGWQMQTDMIWVSPEEAAKWSEGLVKCGEEWLPGEEANAYHAEIGRWWTLPSKYFHVYSTCDWNVAWSAKEIVDQVYPEIVRAVGPIFPDRTPRVLVLRNLTQYNRFGAGDGSAGLPPGEFSGLSSVHYAFVGEGWIDLSITPPLYVGGGVCYWDAEDQAMATYGPLAVRHAAAHSYLQAIDPSWNTVSQAVASPGQQIAGQAFWAEKRIPMWFHYGVASYCERYLRDPSVGDEGNPWWTREWALQNLNSLGGPQALSDIFSFNVSVNDPAGSGKLYTEAGLVLSFVLDGGCAPVQEKHEALKQALRSGADATATREAATALQQAVIDNEEAFRSYCEGIAPAGSSPVGEATDAATGDAATGGAR